MIRNLHRALELVETGFTRYSVLSIGDIMLDCYIMGDVNRISPEAPVPVLRSVRRTHVPGGAANVAMNLAGLGIHTILAGFVGKDEEADTLRALLQEAKIDCAALCAWQRPTISKTRVMSGRQQLLRLDVESSDAPASAEIDRLLASLDTPLASVDAIILSDYAKGALPERVCQYVLQKARARNIPVLVDPKERDFRKYRGATTICPNLQELSVCTGVSPTELDPLMDAGRALIASLGLDYLTVTLSERGIRLLHRDAEQSFHAPARAREVFDVSGAGDTVIATLAASAAAGLDLESSVQLANIAAGIIVAKIGTVPIDRASLLGHLSGDLALNTEEKVLSRPALLARAAQWRSRGQRVVFTNGCFDLLHIGHITLLQDAHRMGDRLVIGVNSDASVSRLKGPSRPIVRENERARILAALASTDAIVVFEEDTPVELIRLLQPDVLVKGGDYTEATVVGAADVRSWGGRVEIVPTVAGFSTTNLVQKMSASSSKPRENRRKSEEQA
ncbi:MAG TPA: bifunctional D-glycero-beta-D-manno-heptose-7-phosphate kinase/D-glycero-beta-D-manno-heptose 1-phosphate adenylyltransferase HldE [Acidobacteriaceae bacterium]|jgi:D-beta-D-heptose 7-phosphate kinase/D-beta-D-heptose 1-phosphate adenosyltransferase|nr:bifunctional D-glycero-beta-D-manno-heptose-7-phosphate kinase/D-glycero-beta-D-manno-heptose 1-phosphate adenylyltransferase HldE [Acidobacteriaceae bacterium]